MLIAVARFVLVGAIALVFMLGGALSGALPDGVQEAGRSISTKSITLTVPEAVAMIFAAIGAAWSAAWWMAHRDMKVQSMSAKIDRLSKMVEEERRKNG